MAFRGDEPVGTIAAFTNRAYNEFQEVNVGFFGFFEVFEDREAAHALLQTAEDWARKAGHETIMGPAQFSTNDDGRGLPNPCNFLGGTDRFSTR